MRERRFLLLGMLAAGAVLLPAASPASAANPTIINTATGCSGQTTWLVSCATGGQADHDANQLRISALVGHDGDVSIPSLLTDDDWDGTTDATTVRSVSAQRPNIATGYPRSRVNLTYQLPTGNTGMSCDGFPTFGGTRRTTNRNARIAARDNNTPTAQTSSTSSSQIKFVATESCLGPEDFAYLYSWGSNNFGNTITPGQSITFTYNGDDTDTTGDADFQGVRWRRRNIRTGTVSSTTEDCDNNGDNAVKSTTVNFPDRGAFVVEAELLDGDCEGDNQNNGFWFPIGTADVNSSAAPTLNLGATRPQVNGNTTITATGLVDPDSADGGGAQIIEWDLDGNTSNGVDGFEATTIAGEGATLSSGQTKTINTTGQSPGLHTVRARVTDNGAMDAADSIRRRSAVVTTTYLVDHPPVANSQTVSTQSNQAKPITLTATDEDDDPLTYTIVSQPTHGTVSGGSGANRTYTPDGDFAGADSFTFRANDNFGGQSAPVTVTVNVTPHTQIISAPDAISGSSTATFQFNSPVTSPPSASAVTFECRIDSTLESDFTACTSPRQYLGLDDGPHKFEVRARLGSFVDPTPAEHTWSIDATSPETFIDTGPDDPTASDSAVFTFHSDDPLATFECRLDSNQEADFTSCASGQTYNLLDEDEHTFEVRATDEFDRTDPIPATYTWNVDLTAPAVTIDSAPDDPTNDTTPEFEFSSTDLTATFQCTLDGGSFAPCTSPQGYGPLGDGSHTFTVKATDEAGNEGPEVSHAWTIDTGVPDTTIDDNPDAQTTSSVADFQFFSDDPTAGFECRLDSTDPGDWEECSDPHRYADVADGFHTFEVRAVDAAGNADASPAMFSWEVDGSAPQTIIDVSPDSLTSSTTADFEFSSDDLAATFECKLDGGDWEGCIDPLEYTGLAPGTHIFRVKATDAFGNTDPTPASRTWTIDTAGPTVSIDNSPQNPSSSNVGVFHYSADEPATFECRFDSTEEVDFEPCNSPTESDPLADGPHTFDVRATDQVGNVGAVESRGWTSDTTAPDVQIDSGMPDTTSSSNASFEFSSTDGTAGFQCRLDDGPWQGCSSNPSPKTYSGLDDGAHSFDVRAMDAVGNTSSPEASDDWTVIDSGPPNTLINGAPGNPTLATDANFSFTSSEPATFECRLDNDPGGFTPCTSPQNYTGLATGEHTFEVRATDDDDDGAKTDATPAVHEWRVEVPPATGGGTGGGGSTGGVAGAASQSPKITPGKGPLKRGSGVAATVECGTGPCTLSGKAKVKIGGRSFSARVNASKSLAGGQAATVTVALSKRARAALALAGKGRLTLSLTATGGGAPVTQQIKLKVTK